MRPDRIARFVSDASEFVAPDQVRPAILRHLLEMLHVDDAAEPERRAAVTEWLRTHEPLPTLRRDLGENGYLPAPPAPPSG